MKRLGRRLAAALAAGIFLSACATRPPVEFAPPAQSQELSDTPFFAQTEHHCGPAALATVLQAAGVQATPETLAPLIYLPGREGSLQAEMLAAARRHDRLPLRLDPQPQALFDALRAEVPVLLLQNLALPRWPRWHYAVLVGTTPDAYVLRSGTTRRELLGARRFRQTWDGADRWAVALARADAIPPFATPVQWLHAAAPFESLGRLDLAQQAYAAATRRWPEFALGWQALGTARYAAGDRFGAQAALSRAVELDPASAAARNNLAQLLVERGCPAAARAQLDALAQVPPAFADALAQTRAAAEHAARQGADRADCTP